MFEDTLFWRIVSTFFVSLMPVVELRGGIPFGVAAGLPVPLAAAISVVGNIIPVPFIILFVRRVFEWLRTKSTRLDNLVTRLERKAISKSDLVKRYSFWGLFIFVAIPLPGTGAWTGALIAAMLEIRLKTAVPAIALGVLSASIIVSCLTFGVSSLFFL